MNVEQPLTDRSAYFSERGRRRINQDAVLVATLPDGAELIAVADGMGGHAAGEIASRRALEVLRAALGEGKAVEEAVRLANAAVYEEASTSPAHQGMGTTLVAVVRTGTQYVVVNVGDSRAYRLDGSGIRQLTEDHSFVAEAIRSGQFSPEEAEKSPWRNAVTRAVGTEPELEVDCFGPFDALEPHAILLCTDGVYRTMPDHDLRSVILGAARLEDAVRDAAAAAYQRGSDDNISLAVVHFGPRPT